MSVIQNYLNDTTIPVEKRTLARDMANTDPAKVESLISQKYGTRYSDSPSSVIKSTGISQSASLEVPAISSSGGVSGGLGKPAKPLAMPDLSASKLPPQGPENPVGIISNVESAIGNGLNAVTSTVGAGIKRGTEGLNQVIDIISDPSKQSIPEALGSVLEGTQKVAQGVVEGTGAALGSPLTFALGASGKTLLDAMGNTPMPGSGLTPAQSWQAIPDPVKSKVGEFLMNAKLPGMSMSLADSKDYWDHLTPDAQQKMGNGARTILDAVLLGQMTSAPRLDANNQPMTAFDAAKIPLKDLGKNMAATFDPLVDSAANAVGGAISSAGTAAKDALTKMATKTPEQIDKEMRIISNDGLSKGIKPTKVAQNTGAYNKLVDANTKSVKDIVRNKADLEILGPEGEPTGKLPTSNNEYLQAIKQRKDKVFNAYDSLAKESEGNGVTISTQKTVDQLDEIANSKVIRTNAPGIAARAQKEADLLRQAESFTPSEAQQAIKLRNSRLDAFYRNPTDTDGAYIDALINNNLRSEMDSKILASTGGQYQDLRDQYAAYKAIEESVAHRAVVIGRRNYKGLLDFTNIFTTGDIVNGLATFNPGQVAKGVVGKGIAEYYKYLNDPDTAISKMFSRADSLLSPSAASSILNDTTGSAVMPTAIFDNGPSIPEVRARMAAEGASKAQIDAKVAEMLPFDGTEARDGLSTADLQGTKGMANLRGPKTSKMPTVGGDNLDLKSLFQRGVEDGKNGVSGTPMRVSGADEAMTADQNAYFAGKYQGQNEKMISDFGKYPKKGEAYYETIKKNERLIKTLTKDLNIPIPKS